MFEMEDAGSIVVESLRRMDTSTTTLLETRESVVRSVRGGHPVTMQRGSTQFTTMTSRDDEMMSVWSESYSVALPGDAPHLLNSRLNSFVRSGERTFGTFAEGTPDDDAAWTGVVETEAPVAPVQPPQLQRDVTQNEASAE